MVQIYSCQCPKAFIFLVCRLRGLLDFILLSPLCPYLYARLH